LQLRNGPLHLFQAVVAGTAAAETEAIELEEEEMERC